MQWVETKLYLRKTFVFSLYSIILKLHFSPTLIDAWMFDQSCRLHALMQWNSPDVCLNI
uniref:Uncharacterized protein n=1 Tax=Arundo donax TaxID=35708 RepID=A0A0A9D2X6_ARUDO